MPLLYLAFEFAAALDAVYGKVHVDVRIFFPVQYQSGRVLVAVCGYELYQFFHFMGNSIAKIVYLFINSIKFARIVEILSRRDELKGRHPEER